MAEAMLPPDQVGLRRQVLTGKDCELWAMTRTIDRQRYGPAAVSHLALLNTGRTPLHLRDIEVSWSTTHLFRCHRPGVIEPRISWMLLDERSFGMLAARTRQQGLRGFGVERTVHEVVVHLDQPEVQQLAFQVSWGFATPSYEMGFFLPALEDQ